MIQSRDKSAALNPRRRQAGAIMIICLIILFSMTLIGVSSMDSAVLELKMSNTMQQQVVALNRAEATLQLAENDIDAMVASAGMFNFELDNDGYYLPGHGHVFEQPDWTGIDVEDGPVTSNNNVDDDDAYVVEYVGSRIGRGESARDQRRPIPGSRVYTFRNTTRSASGRAVVRIVQSVYVTDEMP